MISSRQDLADYCLRTLGAPVLQINVADEQIEDRLDDALQKFWDFHGDGSEKRFIAYQLTEEDFENEYLTLDDQVLTVLRVLPAKVSYSAFNLQLQMFLADLMSVQSIMSEGLHGYVIKSTHLNMMNDLFNTEKQVRFNRHTNRLSIDDAWSEFEVGQFIIIEGYVLIDPETFIKTFNDPWLKQYTTALIKRQWGQNLSKYSGVVLSSGITLDGRAILDDAQRDIEKLENDLYNTYSLPIDFFMG